jgi:hypothetical protein
MCALFAKKKYDYYCGERVSKEKTVSGAGATAMRLRDQFLRYVIYALLGYGKKRWIGAAPAPEKNSPHSHDFVLRSAIFSSKKSRHKYIIITKKKLLVQKQHFIDFPVNENMIITKLH